jgi:hypothetical protein
MLFTQVADISEERWRTDPAADLKTWGIPQCSFTIDWPSAMLEQIGREIQGKVNSSLGEQETGGVLFGHKTPAAIELVTYRALACEHAMGPGFVLSGRDEKRLANLISAPATDPALKGLQALGWYHSHLRSRIFLSERDLQIHTRHFAAPYQIALVIRPAPDGHARAGFFFQESSGAMRTESSYEEFIIWAPLPEVPELKRPVVSASNLSHKRTAAAAKPEEPQPDPTCPMCGSQRLRRSRRTGPIERFYEVFGYYPYRCHECLSRSFLKTSADLVERARSRRRRRPEERRRAWHRTRREMLLWGGGIFGFLAILYFIIRDAGPKRDPEP